jgi:hypothetical protein
MITTRVKIRHVRAQPTDQPGQGYNHSIMVRHSCVCVSSSSSLQSTRLSTFGTSGVLASSKQLCVLAEFPHHGTAKLAAGCCAAS